MKDVRRGDSVAVFNNSRRARSSFARVDVVVRIARDTSTQSPLVSLGNGADGHLTITARHPVFVDGRWVTAAAAAAAADAKTAPTCADVVSDCVYNFVLEASPSGRQPVVVGGVACATWGHETKGDAIIEHAFYGNRARVLANLRGLPMVDGVVQVAGCVRDRNTNEVVGLI